ncbi:MAG: stage II sporulation protein E, partial [Romboutsia sp.]
MERNGAAIKNKNINFNKIKINKYINSKTFIFMIMGFLVSRFTLVDNIAPLGVAFLLCFIKLDKYKYPIFVSTLLGTLLSFNEIAYVLKYGLGLIILLMVSKKLKEVNSILKLSIIGTLIIMPISLGQALYNNINIYSILIILMEGAVIFIGTYIFSFGIKFLMTNKNQMYINPEEIISLSAIVAFCIIGVGNIGILGVSI